MNEARAETGGPRGDFRAQLESGREVTAAQCEACHGPSLLGRYGPPLAGERFIEPWAGRSALEIHEYAHARVPLGRAGTLEPQAYPDVTAEVLEANGYALGDRAFGLEDLGRLRFGQQ